MSDSRLINLNIKNVKNFFNRKSIILKSKTCFLKKLNFFFQKIVIYFKCCDKNVF